MSTSKSFGLLLGALVALTFASQDADARGPGPTRAQLEKGCSAGKAADCIDLAHMWAEGDRGEEDPKKALEIFEKTVCEKLKEAAGCYHAARYYDVGVGVKIDMKKAVRLYTKACNEGFVESCRFLARAYTDGKKIPADLERVRFVLAKACTFGDGRSCYELGNMWQDGRGGEVNLSKARENFQIGCDTMDARCCLQVGAMYREGSGGVKDENLAQHFAGLACQYGGQRFCGADGGGQAGGMSDTRTTTNQREVYNGPCEKGFESARCLITDIARHTAGMNVARLKASEDYFTTKCQEGDGRFCHRLGLIHHDEDPDKARKFYDKGCQLGDNPACVNSAFMSMIADTEREAHNRARLLFFSACEDDDGIGCFNQAVYHFSVLGVERNDVKALEVFTKACELGELEGCFNAGIMWVLGIGPDPDDKKGRAFVERACKDGLERACKTLKAGL